MSCEKLRAGHSIGCVPLHKKYFQQVVLINRADVENKLIRTSEENGNGFFVCRHNVIFSLYAGLSGFRYSGIESGSEIYGYWEKSNVDGVPQYTHIVNIIIAGVRQQEKCLFKQLDLGDYFAAIQYKDGTIEIYGFEYGLTTSNYSYNPQNNSGGGILSLRSLPESLEDEPPLVYAGDKSDFDNNFEGIIYNPNGDFNDDFGDDFYNQVNN